MDPVSSLCSKMFKLHRISELQTQLYFLKTFPHETELMSANLEADNQSYQQSESLREGSFINLFKYSQNNNKINIKNISADVLSTPQPQLKTSVILKKTP